MFPWNIPVDVLIAILGNLSFRDLMSLRLMNRELDGLVGFEVKGRVHSIIRRFSTDPSVFLQHMEETKAVISGSCTAILVASANFEPGDLDVYVPYDQGSKLLGYLKDDGYHITYTRQIRLGLYRQEALLATYRLTRYADGTGPVYNVLVTRTSSALHPILRFDFSFVMNAITSRGVISLYPVLTMRMEGILNDKWLRTTAYPDSKRLAKYAKRGFSVVSPGSNGGLPIGSGMRHIKDRYSLFTPFGSQRGIWYAEGKEDLTWCSERDDPNWVYMLPS
ncbi:hypothetical protein NP233_g1783 [Leucocoprinus birnbaumii]|uniref:F-box domain-containing protein n=1 Tax=Leucocoprinus birnbaumii TaxID=56174 RepID=A0AAD5YVH7_9AGAR|nr:hypothetical protein NP233_g1783 [Leucocoprinus birnbaumii]